MKDPEFRGEPSCLLDGRGLRRRPRARVGSSPRARPCEDQIYPLPGAPGSWVVLPGPQAGLGGREAGMPWQSRLPACHRDSHPAAVAEPLPTPFTAHACLLTPRTVAVAVPRGGLPSRCLHCPPPPPPASCPTQAASGRLSHLGLGTSSGWRTPPAPRLRAMGLLQPSQLGLQPLPNPPRPRGPRKFF